MAAEPVIGDSLSDALAHVVGLMLFESVGYRGMIERFFARLSLYGTPAAIVAVLLLH